MRFIIRVPKRGNPVSPIRCSPGRGSGATGCPRQCLTAARRARPREFPGAAEDALAVLADASVALLMLGASVVTAFRHRATRPVVSHIYRFQWRAACSKRSGYTPLTGHTARVGSNAEYTTARRIPPAGRSLSPLALCGPTYSHGKHPRNPPRRPGRRPRG